mmetsp:Transcript_20323/g.50256  ORF Transcript_20323/g.50256 Transcript_20323/m.50256 type:complete len:254 (+) Transcript_20323:138-899(+)
MNAMAKSSSSTAAARDLHLLLPASNKATPLDLISSRARKESGGPHLGDRSRHECLDRGRRVHQRHPSRGSPGHRVARARVPQAGIGAHHGWQVRDHRGPCGHRPSHFLSRRGPTISSLLNAGYPAGSHSPLSPPWERGARPGFRPRAASYQERPRQLPGGSPRTTRPAGRPVCPPLLPLFRKDRVLAADGSTEKDSALSRAMGPDDAARPLGHPCGPVFRHPGGRLPPDPAPTRHGGAGPTKHRRPLSGLVLR